MLVALDAGAEDIADQGDTLAGHHARPTDLHAVRDALEEAGIAVRLAPTSRCCRPPTVAARDEARRAQAVLRVIDALEEHDDVQNVYANFDIPDAVLAVGGGVIDPVVGERGPRLHAWHGHRRQRATRWPTTGAARWCWCSTRRQHAGVHDPAPRLHATTSSRSTSSARRCSAISPQDVDSHEDFARHQGVRASRCWPTTRPSAAYGILGPLGFYRRSVFVDRRRRHRALRPPAIAGLHLSARPKRAAPRRRGARPRLTRDPRRAAGVR